MRVTIPLAVLALAVLAGCSGSDTASLTTGTTTTTGNDTAKTTVDLNARVNELLAEINSSESAISQGGGGTSSEVVVGRALRLTVLPRNSLAPSFSSTPNDNAAACTFDSTKVVYSCPANTLSSGLIHQASFQFVDTAGKPQAHFDTLATAGIIRWTTLKGTTSQPVQTDSGPKPATQITNNTDSIFLSGIRHGQQHVQNGGGFLRQTIAMTGRDTAFITAPDTTKGIQTSSQVPYPVAGSYTAIVHTVQGTSTSTTNQVTSFNGTSTATLVITFANGTHRTCTYDMTSPAAPVCTGP